MPVGSQEYILSYVSDMMTKFLKTAYYTSTVVLIIPCMCWLVLIRDHNR